MREVAVERGILTEAEASKRTEKELHEILFDARFSTSSVNDVAGRGVGLDAVRAAIVQLRGSAELQTTPGAGTTIVLEMPHSSRRIKVQAFSLADSPLRIAVSTKWSASVVSNGAADARSEVVNVLDALGIARSTYDGRRRRVVCLERDGTKVYIEALDAGTVCSAERICPTAPDELAEVIASGGEEWLFLRPEHLQRAHEVARAAVS